MIPLQLCSKSKLFSAMLFFFLRSSVSSLLNKESMANRVGVLEDVLENTIWSPWPQNLKSSKIGLSSAWEQHYFLSC